MESSWSLGVSARLSGSSSHGEYTQGAGLVLKSQDAVGDPLQVAGQTDSDVTDIPGRKEIRTL